MTQNKSTTFGGDFASATGAIEYGFTNDYMFRIILQENESVLRELICSLLHLRPDELHSVEVKNPIALGKAIDAKDFILDLKIFLNNHSILNLEMQLQNLGNWSERSLSYLCRSFDNLNSGSDYAQVRPAIHIGFLDFTPFPEVPEFYSTYKLLNVKNHHLYSGKFMLSVVDLSQIKLATDEDKAWGIDHWARLFKASTWEELKMISEKNEAMQEASKSLYTMHCDETIRDMARARAERLAWETHITGENAALKTEIEKLSSDNEKLSSSLSEKEAEIAKLKALLAKQQV